MTGNTANFGGRAVTIGKFEIFTLRQPPSGFGPAASCDVAGNRREPIFFGDGDQEVYLDLLAEQVRRRGVEVWAYCLMPNHVRLMLTRPTKPASAWRVGEAHRHDHLPAAARNVVAPR
jgi:hypothetical protein